MVSSGWITLAIIAIASILLVSERLRPDITALLVALSLRLTNVISTEQALSGFSRSAVITILSIFILTNGLERSGVTRWAGQQILRMAGRSDRKLLAVIILTSAALSTFMNTIAAAAVLLPTTMGIARHAQIRPSRLLIPLAFGALLGGTATLLTTANIIVSSTLIDSGLAPFGLFEFAPIGIPLVFCGAVLMVWLAPHLLPSRDVAGEIARIRRLHGELAQLYGLDTGTSEVVVKSDSIMADRTLLDGGWGKKLGFSVLGISRHDRLTLAPNPDEVVRAGDTLLLDGALSPEQFQEFGLEATHEADLLNSLATPEVPLVEATLAPRSKLEGQTLREIDFRERYGFQVIALWRQGRIIQKGIAETTLRFGDAMLLQGPHAKIRQLRRNPNFLILEEDIEARPGAQALIASGIMVLSLVLAATQVLPVSIATLCGAVLMVLAGCLNMEQAYRAVEWKAIFLIAGMLPLSIALEITGTAEAIAHGLYQLTKGYSPLVTGGILLMSASGLSLLLSGQTAAVVMAPVAIAAAAPIQVDPRALAMAVAIGCSLAFISPVGHPANLLVMGPGGYRVRDYLRLGLPLTIVSLLVTIAGLHWVWGL
jgi:di/tricarboxylate transporter